MHAPDTDAASQPSTPHPSATGEPQPPPAAATDPLTSSAGSDPTVGFVPAIPTAPPRRMPVVVVALAIVVLLGGAGLFMAGYTFGQRQASTPGTPIDREQAFAPFWDAYEAIIQRYAGGEVDHGKLIEGAIRGMIGALDDPYSSYLTPEEYRNSLQGISGQFEGIGAEIGTESTSPGEADCATLGDDCRLLVIAPLEGSPAQKAGLDSGDLIVAVDGATVDGMTVDQARERIRGDKGTEVRLTIVRDGGRPFDVTIVRDVIAREEVIHDVLADGTVGYTKLTGFSEHAADVLAEEVRKDVEGGRTRLILDLRRNPGGFVTAARKVASQYIGEGVIFWEERADGTQQPTSATGDGAATDPSIELVVLIDAGSASASEIVAVALRDHERATLVGQTTFGKGTIQTWEELAGGNGAMRLTIAKWLSPDKHWIHREGVRPDIVVPVPADTPANADPVLDRALDLLADSRASSLPTLRRAA
jgi:carboxyl-terminal processing protease